MLPKDVSCLRLHHLSNIDDAAISGISGEGKHLAPKFCMPSFLDPLNAFEGLGQLCRLSLSLSNPRTFALEAPHRLGVPRVFPVAFLPSNLFV